MNQSRKFHVVWGIIVVAVLVFLDQWSKQLAVYSLAGKKDFIIIPGVLQFHYLENTGAAFSLLENKMMFFYILTPILCAFMIFLFVKLPLEKKFLSLRILLVFLVAGAIGNYIDRVLYQYVIDFIYFSLIQFPVFNVADIYVTCSVFVLFIYIIFIYSEEDLTQITSCMKIRK